MITCFSLKGGVGVSSLAANLAVSLSQMWQSKVVLVDLAINSGHASLLLDLDPTYTVADLANESAEDLPGELLDRYLISHSSGVRLLGAPSSNAMTEDLSPRLVDGFLPTLVESFEYVVIDTMHHFSQATVAAVEHTDLLVLVVTPTVAAVKAASDALAILSAIGFPGDQIVPVLNRTFPREGFTRDRVEQTLHRKVATEIPYEGQSMVRAMNRGIPLVTLAPRSRAASAIELLAYNLSEDGQQERRKEASNPVLQRIKRRLLRTSRDAK